MIGGDFNLEGTSVNERLLESSFLRVPYEEESSFRKLHLGSYRGAAIDHILSNKEGVTSSITPDGLYMGDHFPLIAAIEAGVLPTVAKRITVKATPRIKSSDKGGLRRLNRALAKRFADISTFSLVAITDWTVREERRIAESRRYKFNPDGWSPISRLLQLRLRVLGALLKRLLDGAGTAGCHSFYDQARRDIAAVKLSEDEEEWLVANDVPRYLPPWSEWRRKNDAKLLPRK